MSTHDSSFNDSLTLPSNLFQPTNSLFDENITGSDSFDNSLDDSIRSEAEYSPPLRAQSEPAEGEKEFVYTGSMGNLPKPMVEEPVEVEHELEEGYQAEDLILFKLESELHSDQAQRAKELREERDLLRLLNRSLMMAGQGLENAVEKLEAFNHTINVTHELLDTYVRLNSQSQHITQLIKDEEWHGLEADDELQESRRVALERQRAQELYAAQQEREEAAERERKLEAMKNLNLSSGPSVSVRGRGTRGRGLSSSTRPASASLVPSQQAPGRTLSASTPASGRGSGVVRGVRGVRGLRSRGSRVEE